MGRGKILILYITKNQKHAMKWQEKNRKGCHCSDLMHIPYDFFLANSKHAFIFYLRNLVPISFAIARALLLRFCFERAREKF